MHESAETLGIYLSVPFCRAKCSFCNFASGTGTPEAIERYVEKLCAEMRDVRSAARLRGIELPASVNSVYLGGGTPSLLTPGQLDRIFSTLRAEFALAAETEVTLEAAPGQMAASLLERALELGVNRVSLGVQSFVDREAGAVGRSHTEASCLAEFGRLRAAGVRNLGADLIAGLPHQTETSWDHSLQTAVACGLDHLSLYMLEVDEDSRLGREVLGGGARLHAPAVPSDDLTAELYERGCGRFAAAGYLQYEISNFAAEGKSSKHNLKYWFREPYLGFGLDAHSMLGDAEGPALRWANPDELADFDGLSHLASASWGSDREAFEETVFLRLRLVEGLPWSALEGFPKGWQDGVHEASSMLLREGLMGSDGDRLWLTGRGRLISSEIFGELLTGVAA